MRADCAQVKILKILLRVLLILILSGSFASVVIVNFLGYQRFIDNIAEVTSQQQHISFLKSRLTEDNFYLLRKLVWTVLGVLIVITWVVARNFHKIVLKLDSVLSEAAGSFSEYILGHFPRGRERKILFFIIFFFLVRTCFYNYYVPLQHDEIWTYNYFIHGQWWKSFLLPGNNHKLFTFVAWFFNASGIEVQMMMRLPCTLAAITCIIAAYALIRKYFNFSITILAICWFASSVPVGVYATTARSYIFVLLFTILFLHLMTGLMERGSYSKSTGFWLIVISVLGYWSNPVFFFPHFLLSCYLLIFCATSRRIDLFWEYIKYISLIIPALLIFYLPDFLGGHFNALMNVAFPDRNSPTWYLFTSVSGNADFYFGSFKIWWIFLLLPTLPLIFWKKINQPKRNLCLIAGFNVVMISWWAFLTSTNLSYHLCIFLTIYICFLLALILELFLGGITNKWFIPMLAVIIFIGNSLLLNNSSWFFWSYSQDKTAIKATKWLLDHKIHNIYLGYDYIKPGLLFYSELEKKPFAIKMSNISSFDYSPFVKDETEAILEYIENPLPDDIKTGFAEKFSDENVVIYLR